MNAVVSDGSGGWFIGGSFASIGTRHADNLAHVNADGTLDTGFTGGTDGPVYTLASTGSTVFAGGFFSHASDGILGSRQRASLAAFDGTTGTLTAFNPGVGGSGAFVSALELSGPTGPTLYVGGSFSTLGGVARDNLGAVSLAGAATGWSPRTNDFVNSIAVGPGPANTVYVGGFFHTVNGNVTRNFAAAFDPATGTVTTWNPNVGVVTSNPAIDAVYAVEVSGSTVYLGGHFALVGGQPRDSLAAVDATNGVFTGWNPSVVGAVYQLAISGSTVYAAGSFQNVNNSRLGLRQPRRPERGQRRDDRLLAHRRRRRLRAGHKRHEGRRRRLLPLGRLDPGPGGGGTARQHRRDRPDERPGDGLEPAHERHRLRAGHLRLDGLRRRRLHHRERGRRPPPPGGVRRRRPTTRAGTRT